MFRKQKYTQEKRARDMDFMIIDEINFFSFVNSDSIYIFIRDIEKLKLAKIQF